MNELEMDEFEMGMMRAMVKAAERQADALERMADAAEKVANCVRESPSGIPWIEVNTG